MGQSSTLNIFVSHFRFVASFQNEGDSNSMTTGVENRGQISHIFTLCKN